MLMAWFKCNNKFDVSFQLYVVYSTRKQLYTFINKAKQYLCVCSCNKADIDSKTGNDKNKEYYSARLGEVYCIGCI